MERNGAIDNYSVIVWNLDTNEVAYSNFTPSSSLTITSLAPYHNYKCAVAANGQLGLGPFDDRNVWVSGTGKDIINVTMHLHVTIFYCTMTTDHAFGSPSNLQTDHVTSSSFRVTWGEPSVRYGTSVLIDSYQIRVFDYQENRTISNNTYTTRLYYHEQGSLHPNYRYLIEVSAIAVAGTRGPVASHSLQTSEDSRCIMKG